MKWLNTFKIRILDRYIISKFLGTFFFALLMIIVITVVFDISERIDDFIDKKAPLEAIVFDYYFNFIPYFISLFSSLFIFISVIFFTAKMASQTEIIAILSSGISFRRFLYPYFIGACILALFSFVINDMIMPSANKNRLDFEDKYIKNPVIYLERNVHKQVEPGLFVYFESFSNSTEQAYQFSMERYKGDRLVSKLISHGSAKWDKEKEKWTINDYYIRDIDSLGYETLHSGASIDTTINLHPSEFKRRANFIETMSIVQLSEFIDNLRMQGAVVDSFLIELHKRIAFPFSTFILTLIGVSLSTRKVRGGIGIHVAIGIAISFLYILFMQFSAEFATKGNLHPIVAAWIPNIIFGFVAAFLYRLAPK